MTTMRRQCDATSRLITALTLSLVLIWSQVSEGHRLLLGLKPAFAPAPTHSTPSFSPSPALPRTFSPSPSPSASSTLPDHQFSPSPSSSSPAPSEDGLRVGFYKGKCPDKTLDVEAFIADQIKVAFQKDPTLLPAFLRLQFHDCFVHGCDASILVDGPSTEKTAGPNLSVRGYELIEALKASIEEQCAGVVSCADIIAIATKVLLQLGGGPNYPLPTGRRDGLISRAEDVDLPSPFITVPESITAFAAKNFTPEEMVILLDGHAVGITHCAFFQGRLYKNDSMFDSEMDPNLRQQLIPTCPQDNISDNSTLLNQDPQQNNVVDNSFYNQLLMNRGILPIDQALSRHPATNGTVMELAQNAALFHTKLANAMVKLQALDVLTGSKGQIRQVCGQIH